MFINLAIGHSIIVTRSVTGNIVTRSVTGNIVTPSVTGNWVAGRASPFAYAALQIKLISSVTFTLFSIHFLVRALVRRVLQVALDRKPHQACDTVNLQFPHNIGSICIDSFRAQR